MVQGVERARRPGKHGVGLRALALAGPVNRLVGSRPPQVGAGSRLRYQARQLAVKRGRRDRKYLVDAHHARLLGA